MSHDPKAVEVLADAELSTYLGTASDDCPFVGVRNNLDAAHIALARLTAANLAVIEVGTVPPWMERVAERALMLPKDEPDSWWYGDDNSHIEPSAPSWQPLYIIREDKP